MSAKLLSWQPNLDWLVSRHEMGHNGSFHYRHHPLKSTVHDILAVITKCKSQFKLQISWKHAVHDIHAVIIKCKSQFKLQISWKHSGNLTPIHCFFYLDSTSHTYHKTKILSTETNSRRAWQIYRSLAMYKRNATRKEKRKWKEMQNMVLKLYYTLSAPFFISLMLHGPFSYKLCT